MTTIEPESDSPAQVAAAIRRKGLARRMVEGTFHYGLGQSIPKLISFLLIPIYTRFLTPTDYGHLEIAIAFGGFLMTLMRQGVPGAVARYYYDYEEGASLCDYVTTVAWFLLGASLTVGLIALAICPWILGSVLPGLPLPFALLATLSAIAFCNSELQSRLVQAREQSSYQARLNVGRASISITLAILFVIVLRLGAAGILAAEVVSYGGLALIAIYYLRRELRGRFRWPMLKSSLAYGWAMMPGDFIGALRPLATRLLLTGARTAAATGVLGIANRIAQPLTLLAVAFQTAFNPIYFSIRKEGTVDGLRRLAVALRNVWAIAVGCAVAAALLGPPLVITITPRAFHPAAPLIPIIAVAFLGMTAYYAIVPELFYGKKTWLLPIIAYGSATIDIGTSALCAEKYGAEGVAWGSAGGWLVSACIAGIITHRLVDIRYPWFSIVRITLCGLVAWLPAAVFASPHVALQFVGGIGGSIFYLGLLWLSGDPSIRDIFGFVRRRIVQRLT